jgi:hypothetical protein
METPVTASKTWLTTLALAAASLPALAGTGAWASFVGIDADAGGAAATQWFDGPAWSTALLPDYAGANLGSFAQGSSAWLSGGDLFTWKGDAGDVTGGRMYWRVDGGSYTEVVFGFGDNQPLTIPGTATTTGGGNDQSWRNTAINADFLAGLTPGSHTLQVYFKALTNEGDRLTGSDATPFSANFTVTSAVPEPGAMALMLAGLMGLVGLRRVRRTPQG